MILYPPADIVAQLLVDQGIGKWAADESIVLADWPVTTDMMPDQTGPEFDNYLTVYDTGANPDGRNYRNGDRVEHPTVSIRVRAIDDKTAKTKAREVQAVLLKVGGRVGRNGMLGQRTVAINVDETVARVVVKSVFVGPVVPLKQEEVDRRRVYVMNARITLEEG